MFPTIDDRLACVARALETVIIPALPAEQSLAIEQAHLSLMHIRALLGQAAELAGVVCDEMHDATLLLNELRTIAPPQVFPGLHRDSASTVPGESSELLAEIDIRIGQISVGDDEGRWLALKAPVIRHARARARAEARWFAGFGMPSLDDV